MMMLEDVQDELLHKGVTMTHTIIQPGQRRDQRPDHLIRFYQPNPAAGPFAGKLIASYRLNPDQAKELKANL